MTGDSDLLSDAAQGDASAYRALLERHVAAVHALAYRLLADRAEAEDVVQESFAALWQALGGSGKPAPPDHNAAAWLKRVARNRSLDRLRRRARWRGDEDGLDTMVDQKPSAENAHADAETGEIVRAAIEALPDRQRVALTLVHFEEMAQKEVADALGISVDALESLLARARRTLKSRLIAEKESIL